MSVRSGGATLPSISCKRYGLTSAEFIDYIIFPDMLCLEHMRSMKASYEEAVSEMSTGRKSRLSVYWNYALCHVSDVEILSLCLTDV